MPTHILIAMSLHTSILQQVNRLIRAFLWQGRKTTNGGHCLVSWARVCRPLAFGGLGVPNLQRCACALQTHWLWLRKTDPSRPWLHLHIPCSPAVQAIFRASTVWTLGNGNSCRFWTDHWVDGASISELAPLVHALVPRRRRKVRSVAEGLAGCAWVRDIQGSLGPEALAQYICLWARLCNITLSDAPDLLSWHWTPNGAYSAKSCYKALFSGSTIEPAWKLTWKSWAPLRVKIFLWLAYQGRCWTADRLARRGLAHTPLCLLCDQEPKTMEHLLAGCSFTRQTWHEILSWYRITDMPLPGPSTDFRDWFSLAVQDVPTSLRRGLASLIILTAWRLWKARNDCVFNGATPSISRLVNDIKVDARSWATAGAKGLSNLLPAP